MNIQNNSIEKYYPLTHSQKSIWYSEKLFPNSSMGNIAATLRMFSNVDYSLLEQAINIYLKKNDAVRLRIVEISGEPWQYVSEYTYHKFEQIDFDGNLEELYKWDEKQTRTSMDIIEADLFSFVLIKINDTDGGFFVKFHHFISDAWTMSLLGNYVMEYYTALKNGDQIEEADKPSFLDYIESEKKYKETSRFQKDKAYWTEKFADWQEITALKTRKTGSQSTKARRKTLLIPQKLTAKIHEYCNQKGISEFSLFLAAISMYINRVTNKEDLVFGTTLLNRSNVREKDTAGMFANVAVPLRFYIKDDMNFNQFVENVTKELMTVFRHQKYPYDLILKEVRERRGSSDNLFDIVLTYQNSKFIKEQNFEKYITRWHFTGHQIESLIINLNDRENDGRLIIDYDYLADMFYATEIEFIHNHVISLLWHALDNPVKIISKLEMISEKEKQKILYKFNDTKADFPNDKTVQELFEEQVQRTPNNIAVVCGDRSISYKELNEKANQLARALREKGVKPDNIIGIMFDRSVEMIISIFAILKAGGAYLPIDPQYPEDRIKYMIENGGLQILLSSPEHFDKYRHFNLEIINLEDKALFKGDKSNIKNINSSTDLAYVIYTSGSTGKPKGVMIEHRSLINRINWMQKKYPLDENSVILQKTTYTFDVSVWELIWWSFIGAQVCMLEPGGEKDPLAIIRAIQKYKVTTMHFVPSMLSIFLQFLEGYADVTALRSLKQVFASGEALTLQQVKIFNELLYLTNGTELYNLYGPTEAAIDVTSFDCSPRVELGSVPIGKPIDNIQLYILDKHYNLLPIGIPGELFIGGVGLSRGYVNRPELTEEKFIPNPFIPGEKLYRTGDLARWYSEGDIEYLGRIDHQIKIRGFRIELGEIENKLQSHSAIKENVVIGLEDGDKKYLCAYYVADKDLQAKELKRFLSSTLPEYMVPSFYIRMDALPLSSNGKIDRKILPKPIISMEDSQAEYVEPRNALDEELVKLFCQALKIDNIGIDDSFFDLGGDSLTVMVLFAQIYDRNWGISAADLYSYPTIRELSDRITGGDKENERVDLDDIEVLEPRPKPDSLEEVYDIENVLLTGTTGFLGVHVLSELLEQIDDCTVFCLVRAKDNLAAEERLRSNLFFYFGDKYKELIGTRIISIKGDISLPQFGLDEEMYDQLGNNIDTIIHSAAIVKYYGDYHEIEKINVNGTQEICDFALKYDIKLNYISTDAVTGNYLVENSISCDYTENDFYVGQNYLDNIYVRSKFEAENAVFKSIKKGLRATVFRMGNLTGRYCDGHFQLNIGENAFYSAIRSILKLGAVSHELLNEEIEFSPVDLSAQAVAKIVRTRESDNRVFHILNHNRINMKDLVKVFRDMGSQIQIMNTDEMNRYIEEELDDEKRRDILPGIMVYLNRTGEIACSVLINIVSDLTVDYLKELDFEWPYADAEYLFKIIDYVRGTNYLD